MLTRVFRHASLVMVLSIGTLAHSRDAVAPHPQPPQVVFADLFEAVQTARIFADGKAFADAVPNSAPELILADYHAQRPATTDALLRFVEAHFTLPPDVTPMAASLEKVSITDHINGLWKTLTRGTASTPPHASLLPLPYPYVVPGGRFREMYYWDSYFTMLGLVQSGRQELVDSMVADFAYLIDTYGHVPNGTRTYYLSRSQPPFFFEMVGLVAADDPPKAYARYLSQLRREYEFWMQGAKDLRRGGTADARNSEARDLRRGGTADARNSEPGDLRNDGATPAHDNERDKPHHAAEGRTGRAARRVVVLPDGAVLNRFWDDRDSPRDESYREDTELARQGGREPRQLYRDIRAAAESGWDFSSRWFADGRTRASLDTTQVIPVDLNSLMYGLERAIAAGCERGGDAPCARDFERRAMRRHAAMDRYLWTPRRGVYLDYRWTRRKPVGRVSAATLYPLFVGLASDSQASEVATATRTLLLEPGGIVTTPLDTGQQWDSPNGWAPLQWIAVDGLRRYHQDALAAAIACRWMSGVNQAYRDSGKLVEKYDVVNPGRRGGGGEYPTQDGFGWTNGVMLELAALYPAQADYAAASDCPPASSSAATPNVK